MTGPVPAEPRIPGWITDLDLIESYLAGHVDIPDDLNPAPKETAS